jgi:uncharacterized protein (TIGR01777 family)
MKVVIPGGSGQVGTLLARDFRRHGYEVVVLSRTPPRRQRLWRVVAWDGATPGPWAAELDGADVVVNLAGRSVNCRYTRAHRAEILRSRVDSTRVVGEAIAQAARPPRVWLQAGTATIYAHRYDAPNDEASGLIGGGERGARRAWRFSTDVAKAWEAALQAAPTPHTRKVILRSAMTMSPDPGGVFAVMLGLVRRGLGGRAGNGRQFVSWIHDQDFLAAVQFLIQREDITGPVNLAAPNPLPNAEFMRWFRLTWGTRLGLPAPRPLLALGAILLRTETELVLKSRRVVPGLLLQAGFKFRFPAWPEAVQDLCRRWRD